MSAFAATAVDESALRKSRAAITVLFFVFGLNIGTWAAHIPVIQARLTLSPSMLGLALLSAAIGTLVAQPPLGLLMARTGSRTPTMVFAILASTALILIVFSPSVPFLFAALFYTGVAWAGLNVAMNTQASEIETRRGKPTMSTFHAAASLGMLGGTALGAAAIGAGLGNGTGAGLIAIAAIMIAVLTFPFYVRDQQKERGAAFVLPNRAVFGLGALACLMFLVEGAMVDWSAVFLSLEKGASASWAAAGFGFFTAAMATVRMIGNQVVMRLGRRWTVVGGGILVTLGIFVAVSAPWPLASALGFAIVGIGAANVVPILISTAAQTPGISPSVAVGAVGTMMTIGFLVGPPLIGFISESFGLSTGIGLIGAVGLAVAAAAIVRTWPAAPGGERAG